MENILLKKSINVINSTNISIKSDWEELADICYEAATKKNLTKEDSRHLLKQAREILNARSY